ncbi:hypothetical protein ACIBCS_04305 [Streptomyces phaeochromogenes]|uniref:hypothetical protein n=1 Tax=Streptomyces phaeochromogenes TaxID=1923 RepID=UPI003790CE2D
MKRPTRRPRQRQPEAATRHGVAVSFAPGRNATATAEHTVALMMAAARHVPATHADLAAGTCSEVTTT